MIHFFFVLLRMITANTTPSQYDYNETIQKVVKAIKDAEYILVGGASGMSAASGPDWYNDNDPIYLRNFQDIESKYHPGSLWKSYYLDHYSTQSWKSRDDWWGFLITLMHFMKHEPIYQPYADLKEILEGKDYDIVTTNQDGQFVKAFPEKDVAIIQGDWMYFQCSQSCHDKVYPGSELIDELYSHVEDGSLPSKYIPHCEKCGAEMREWVRGFEFLQGEFYGQQYEKYHKYIAKAENRKTIYLELGVGMMTPMFIKKPFMNFAEKNKNSIYMPINPKHAIVPDKIKDRSIPVKYDIARVLSDIKKIMKY